MIKLRTLTIALGLSATFGLSASALAQETYIPLISKGFQHQFWQAVKQGAEQAAKDLNVKVTFEGPESEAMVDKQIDMLSAALAKNPKAIGCSRRHRPPRSRLWPSTRASTATYR
jgi:ribose transport system substrate-binding protein